MKDLLEIFHTLPDRYADLYNQVNEMELEIGWTDVNQYRLEPYCESRPQLAAPVELLDSPDDLEAEDAVLVCSVNNEVVYTRCAYSYETFFIKHGNTRLSLQVFTGDENIKPIFVERFEVNNKGEPVRYAHCTGQSYYTATYEHTDSTTTESKKYYTGDGELHAEDSRIIAFNGDRTLIEKITCGTSGDVIFSQDLDNNDLSTLLSDAEERLLDTIVQDLSRIDLSTIKVARLLMEYTLQGPFPPTLAIIQAHEVTTTFHGEEEHPLAYLNAPDVELFSEEKLEGVDLYKDSALYDAINLKLDDVPYEERKQTVFNCYVSLCQKLRDHDALSALLDCTEDYFVVARDFEECNEMRYLRALLPVEQVEQLEKEVTEYEEGLKNNVNHDPDVIYAREIFASEEGKYDYLLEQQTGLELVAKYSVFKFNPVRPFYREMYWSRPVTDAEIFSTTPPKQDYYYRYLFHNNEIVRVEYLNTGEVTLQTFIDRGDSHHYTHCYSTDSKTLHTVDILALNKGKPEIYERFEGSSYYETTYDFNESGQISHMNDKRQIHIATVLNKQEFKSLLSYDQRGTLKRIESIETTRRPKV